MKELPIGIQSFQKLRERDALYIDKTKHLYELVTQGGYYFISRPRRFGKSLTISTLKEIFLGNKALFKDLWIEDKIEWTAHPVIHLSFSNLTTDPLLFASELRRKLFETAEEYGLAIEAGSIKELVEKLVKGLAKERGVVVLIDEYDKPIVDYIQDLKKAEANRLVLKDFFEGFKDLDYYLRFLFITGVSKFSKLSLFSGLNNLNDITVGGNLSTLCGYTQKELDEHFGEVFEKMAAKFNWALEELKEEVRLFYNGYSWKGEKVYNPWSILNMADKLDFGPYWAASGNPEFLIKKLHAGMRFDFEELTVAGSLLESHTLENMDYRNLLFQTGYVTVLSTDVRTQLYTLGFPNREVKDALTQLMYGEFAFKLPGDAAPTALDLAHALRDGDLEQAVRIVNSLFSSIPYQIFLAQYEAYYHSILHIMFSLLGYFIQCEKPSARGRTDAIVHTNDRIYIFEFKVDGTGEQAISQIKTKGYAAPYLASGKEIIMVGIGFGKEKKGVSDWAQEKV